VIAVGIAGYGTAGRNLHAPLLGGSDAYRVRVVADPRVPEVADRLPGVRVVGTLDQLLDDPDVELVIIATPNASHGPLVAQALRAGRDVVVDKPFVPTIREADRLIDIAERSGRLLSVFHSRRWDDDFLTVTDVLLRGQLGPVHRYVARFEFLNRGPVPVDDWRRTPGPGSGLLYDVGSHMIDHVISLLGVPEIVFARLSADAGRPEHGFALVLEVAGTEVVLLGSERTALPGPTFEVHGQHGSLVVDGPRDGQEAILAAGSGPPGPGGEAVPARLRLAGDAAPRPIPRSPGDYGTYYRLLARAIRRGGPPPVTADSARAVIAVIEAAHRSARSGRVARP
jgi:scyllo-inositol 2-dehydrogenase (NADP+)